MVIGWQAFAEWPALGFLPRTGAPYGRRCFYHELSGLIWVARRKDRRNHKTKAMKTISCADMPGSDGACNHIVKGESTQECIDQMFAHAGEAHADKIASMTPEQGEQMTAFMRQFLDAQA